MVNGGVGISGCTMHKDAVTHLAPFPRHAARLNYLTPVPCCVTCFPNGRLSSIGGLSLKMLVVVGEKECWDRSSTTNYSSLKRRFTQVQ